MARSEYVIRRLAEIGPRPKGPQHVLQRLGPKPRRVLKYGQPPRAETIDRIGMLYVRHVRAESGSRNDATWFDVAKAYADGWKDAESVQQQDRDGGSL